MDNHVFFVNDHVDYLDDNVNIDLNIDFHFDLDVFININVNVVYDDCGLGRPSSVILGGERVRCFLPPKLSPFWVQP